MSNYVTRLLIESCLNLTIDDAYFQPELGWSVWGSLGWTKTAGGLNWRTLDRLGCDKAAATLTCEIRSQHFSAKNQEKGGSARASPVAAPMPKSVTLLEKIDTS